VFIGNNDAYALTLDLATALGVQCSSIRSVLSRNKLGTLIGVPELKRWLIDQGMFDSKVGKMSFASKDIWLQLLKINLSQSALDTVKESVNKAIEAQAAAQTSPAAEPVNKEQDSDEDVQLFDSPEIANDDDIWGEVQVAAHEPDLAADPLTDGTIAMDVDENHSNVHDKYAVPIYIEKEDADLLDEKEDGNSSAENDNESEHRSSDSESDSDSASNGIKLPQGVPEWVLDVPRIPKQFSPKQYTKSYALKTYDTPTGLRKELKRLNKWWTTAVNPTRSGKAVHATTIYKREERIRCFLGFVQRYKCLPAGHDLTLGLFLNHRLVLDGYLEYLKVVRCASDGTICESLTAAISACKWLYRKQPASDITIIRRYKDTRNHYQTMASRTRKDNDVEQLELDGKWLGNTSTFDTTFSNTNTDWSEFTQLIGNLRNEWQPRGVPTIKEAHQLHDLLLLGLYSCIPARGSEVRLLEFVPESDIKDELKGNVTLKKYVDKEKINLITQQNGVWMMLVSQYKVMSVFHFLI